MSHAPDGYHTIIPYLIVPNTASFIVFMKNVFGAELINQHMRDETIIMHAEVKVGDTIIMFADSTPQYAPMASPFFIYVENADATYQLAMQHGATVVTEMGDQSYGRSGGVTDPFGNTWWITSVQK